MYGHDAVRPRPSIIQSTTILCDNIAWCNLDVVVIETMAYMYKMVYSQKQHNVASIHRLRLVAIGNKHAMLQTCWLQVLQLSCYMQKYLLIIMHCMNLLGVVSMETK